MSDESTDNRGTSPALPRYVTAPANFRRWYQTGKDLKQELPSTTLGAGLKQYPVEDRHLHIGETGERLFIRAQDLHGLRSTS
jgi:hypothetical protein